MRIVKLSEIRDELKGHMNRQELFPIIGSGFTRGCPTRGGSGGCVPSGQDMKEEMERYLQDHGHAIQPGCSFSKVARYYEKFAAKADVWTYFKERFLGVVLTGPRKEFLNLDWKLIYTLNLDDAIEKNSPYQCTVLPNRKDLNLDAIKDEKCVFKLHGDAGEFIKYGDKRDKVLSLIDYIASLNSNQPLLDKLGTDLDFSNTLFIGCSLNDELDILSVAQQLRTEPVAQRNRYFVLDRDPNEFLEVDLEDYKIDTVIRVDSYDAFYREFVELAKECGTAQDGLSEFCNLPCKSAPRKQNIDYLICGKFLLNKRENTVYFPEFFIERDIEAKIFREMEDSQLQIVHGARVSGKSYLLAGLLRKIHDRDVYYFDSRNQVDQKLLTQLLHKKQSLFLFDTNVLTLDAIETLIKTDCTQLRADGIHVICCVNNSDREVLELVGYERRHLGVYQSYIRTYELKSSFLTRQSGQDSELNAINKKLKLAGQLPFAGNQTILDNLLDMQKKLRVSKLDRFDPPLKVQQNDIEKVCLLILLAQNERVTARELTQCGLRTKSGALMDELRLTVEEDHRSLLTLNAVDSSSYQIVCNAKVWMLNQLREIGKVTSLQQTIVKAFQRLVGDFLGGTRKFKRVERLVKFDKLNEIFPGGKRLVIDIYEGLNSTLNESYQYYHQYAKCHLWGMSSPSYKTEELEEARIAALTALRMIEEELERGETLGRKMAYAHILNTLTIISTKKCFFENFAISATVEEAIEYFHKAIQCRENEEAMCQAKDGKYTAKEEEGGVLKNWISHVPTEEVNIPSGCANQLKDLLNNWQSLGKS